jgi:hypothetical protein
MFVGGAFGAGRVLAASKKMGFPIVVRERASKGIDPIGVR